MPPARARQAPRRGRQRSGEPGQQPAAQLAPGTAPPPAPREAAAARRERPPAPDAGLAGERRAHGQRRPLPAPRPLPEGSTRPAASHCLPSKGGRGRRGRCSQRPLHPPERRRTRGLGAAPGRNRLTCARHRRAWRRLCPRVPLRSRCHRLPARGPPRPTAARPHPASRHFRERHISLGAQRPPLQLTVREKQSQWGCRPWDRSC